MTVAELDTINAANKTKLRHRTKGERTREKVLIAAIDVLAEKGIKGTTHRAIANQAQLQLSLTTYYFKDIQELIHQAFKLNSEQILSRSDSVLEQAFTLINSVDKVSLRKVAVKEQLCQQLSRITANYLHDHIQNQATSLAVEQLLFTEIQVSPQLRQLASQHEQAQLMPFEYLCRFFNKVDPELDAKIMRTVFTQLKYSHLAQCKKSIDVKEIETTTRKIIGWVMGLK